MLARLLVLDNYDSFTFNLVQMFQRYRHRLRVSVVRSDDTTVDQVARDPPDYIVVGPGPKAPDSAGICIRLIEQLHPRCPILGVCLGMQCINEAFGGTTVRAPVPVHGKTSLVFHEQHGLFATVPSPFKAARYHSLVVAGLHPALEITARTSDGVVMGLSHRTHPLHGVQFHPESFLSEYGVPIVENFLRTGPMQHELAR